MRRMGLGLDEEGPLTLLAVGCHADDLEIGCGGAVLDLASRGALAKVVWVVLSGAGERADEARAAASGAALGRASRSPRAGLPRELHALGG